MQVVRNIEEIEEYLEKRKKEKKRLSERVSKILKDVKSGGDKVLIEYTKKFDNVKLSLRELRVSESEISASFNELNSQLITALKCAIDNVTKFYQQQVCESVRIKEENGKVIRVKYIPLERVGIYIPGGSAPLVSTVYMCAVPALVGGVKEIVLVSPPNKEKMINPFILAVASLLKIKEIYKVGGAQAIGALAYGTKTIRKVDKIVGPGNEFVTEAKRQVFGEVGIDTLAGPSEIVIIASGDTNVDYIVVDMEAQLEHKEATAIVITNSQKIVSQLKDKKIDGLVVKVKNLSDACVLVNKLSPEHLEIFTRKPSSLLKKIKNAPAIFLGENTPSSLGDYTAGCSHVLPTQGKARFFSPLSLKEFLKEVHIISYTKKALSEEFPVLEKIASLEGMWKHIESVRKRLS